MTVYIADPSPPPLHKTSVVSTVIANGSSGSVTTKFAVSSQPFSSVTTTE